MDAASLVLSARAADGETIKQQGASARVAPPGVPTYPDDMILRHGQVALNAGSWTD